MNKIKVGDSVITCNGHKGVVIKIYKSTGSDYCTIREFNKKTYICPISYVLKEAENYGKNNEN